MRKRSSILHSGKLCAILAADKVRIIKLFIRGLENMTLAEIKVGQDAVLRTIGGTFRRSAWKSIQAGSV